MSKEFSNCFSIAHTLAFWLLSDINPYKVILLTLLMITWFYFIKGTFIKLFRFHMSTNKSFEKAVKNYEQRI